MTENPADGHKCDWCEEPAIRSRQTWGGESYANDVDYSAAIRWYACAVHLKQLESRMAKQKDPRKGLKCPDSEKLFDDAALNPPF